MNTADQRSPQPAKSQLLEDTLKGLLATPKTLPCKYLYDEKGSELFEQICACKDYYVTRTEMALMHDCIEEVAHCIGKHANIIEPGAGAGQKTRTLLSALDSPEAYTAVEISPTALAQSAQRITEQFPALTVCSVCADFSRPFDHAPVAQTNINNVVYFPGSTLGNFDSIEAQRLLQRLKQLAGDKGAILLGVDLLKDRQVLERAYDDSEGVTAQFNLNLLARLNHELDCDFALNNFTHEARFNGRFNRIEMHLVSQCRQQVHVCGQTISFQQGETIHTENSHKYTLPGLKQLLASAGLCIEKAWTDKKSWFGLFYLRSSKSV